MPITRSLIRLLLGAALAIAGLAARAEGFDTAATAAYAVDVNTGTVLLDKNGDMPMPPASMSKLMTIELLFKALADGRVTLDSVFAVSTRAKNMGGSTMFLNETDRPTVEQLIQGIIVLSGNDACVTVAEGLAGSEDEFARQMNARAKELGLTHSQFANASGWPDPGQLMSMHDLATLAVHIIKTYPEYYHYFSQRTFAYDGRAPANVQNRDPLLGRVPGADGMKTGHTEASGYGLVGTALQGDRRVLAVLNGLPSVQARAAEGEKVINWAFRSFLMRKIASAGQVIATAPVWAGDKPSVGMTVASDLSLLVPVTAPTRMQAQIVYSSPVQAPVAAGQKLGEMVFHFDGMKDVKVSLVATEAVTAGGFVSRLQTAAQVLLRWVRPQQPATPAAPALGGS